MDDLSEMEMQKVLQSLGKITSENCRKMGEIWKKLFGNDRAVFKDRLTAVGNHIQDLFNEMLAEETERLKAAEDDITSLMREKKLLEEELGMTIDAPDSAESKLPILVLQNRLEASLENYRKLKEERIEALRNLQSRELALCERMDYQPKYGNVKNLPSDDFLKEITKYLDSLESIKNDRYNTFRTVRLEISDMFNHLQSVKYSSPFEQLVINGDESLFKVSDGNMKLLAELRDELEEKVNLEKKRVMEMREKVSMLWDRLACDAKHREVFSLRYQGFGKVTSDALREEIARCEELKRDNIELFITRIRQDLAALWEKCLLSEEQKSAFAEYTSEQYDEELLDAHEREVERLKKYYDENEGIFRLAAERAELWEEMNRLEGATNQPERLFSNRGGKLLQEEQKRKRIKQVLPKLEQMLMEKLNDYKNQNGEDFMYYGEPLKQVMDQQRKNKKIQQESKKVFKQVQKSQPLGNLGKTPSGNTAMKKRVCTPCTAPGGNMRARVATFTPLRNIENIQPEAVSSGPSFRRILNLNSAKSQKVRVRSRISKSATRQPKGFQKENPSIAHQADINSGTNVDDHEFVQLPEIQGDRHSVSDPLIDVGNEVVDH